MKKEFVRYEQALALKELGFDEECFAVYYDSETHVFLKEFKTYTGAWVKFNSEFDGKGVTSAPHYQQAFRWFREKYDLRIWIESNRGVLFYEYIIATTNPSFINRQFTNNEVFNTYEEAEQSCLDKLIEIVKNK